MCSCFLGLVGVLLSLYTTHCIVLSVMLLVSFGGLTEAKPNLTLSLLASGHYSHVPLSLLLVLCLRPVLHLWYLVPVVLVSFDGVGM